jgi:hypothetical protein
MDKQMLITILPQLGRLENVVRTIRVFRVVEMEFGSPSLAAGQQLLKVLLGVPEYEVVLDDTRPDKLFDNVLHNGAIDKRQQRPPTVLSQSINSRYCSSANDNSFHLGLACSSSCPS